MTKKPEKNNKKIILKAVFIGIIFLCGYLVTFIHYEYTRLKEWSVYKEHKKGYKEIIKTSKAGTKSVIDDLKHNGLDEYASKLEGINEAKRIALKKYTAKKKKLANDYSFLGYESKQIFFYDFGKSLATLIPVLILLFILINPSLIKELKVFLIIGVLGLLYVSFFWIIHNIFSMSDFGANSYRFSYIIGSLLATGLTFLIFNFYSRLEKIKIKNKKETEDFIKHSMEALDELKKLSIN